MAIGRALQCGYNLFFKAWRDSAYDAVLDFDGVLFRIEIKGSSTSSFAVTGGGRAGAQIDRTGPDREHILRKEDCDILLAISGKTGHCYIIPVEILEIFGQKSVSFTKIEIFKEKWQVIKGVLLKKDKFFSSSLIQTGFQNMSLNDLKKLCKKYEIPFKNESSKEWPGFQGGKITNLDEKSRIILDIWEFLYKNL
ncbi:MAG: hypothetical protein OEZ22_09710 [Spirochaetia bacterium]|nr:hypothetical protein [Spirochaetia bacterium]